MSREINLPPLPERPEGTGEWHKWEGRLIEAYARAAVEKDRAERGGVPDSQKLPFGYQLMAVKNFDALLKALDRAESKGYMPDAILGEWEAFEYSQVPEPVHGAGDCAVCVLGIGGACYCGKAAPQPQPVQEAQPVAFRVRTVLIDCLGPWRYFTGLPAIKRQDEDLELLYTSKPQAAQLEPT